jgi:hypothetical protein
LEGENILKDPLTRDSATMKASRLGVEFELANFPSFFNQLQSAILGGLGKSHPRLSNLQSQIPCPAHLVPDMGSFTCHREIHLA